MADINTKKLFPVSIVDQQEKAFIDKLKTINK